MDDLLDMNLKLADYLYGPLSPAQRDYLLQVNASLFNLVPSAQALQAFFEKRREASSTLTENKLRTIYANRDYLNLARLYSKDILKGECAKLVALNLQWAQARLLADLTNQQITWLSSHWHGEIFVARQSFIQNIPPIHPIAAAYHARATALAA